MAIQVLLYCCYRLFSICFCEDCLVFWESGRVRTGKKTTKRERGKKALSRYKIQESQMVTEPETSCCVELSQTANSWINPDCFQTVQSTASLAAQHCNFIFTGSISSTWNGLILYWKQQSVQKVCLNSVVNNLALWEHKTIQYRQSLSVHIQNCHGCQSESAERTPQRT